MVEDHEDRHHALGLGVNSRKRRLLLGMYPKAWRRRYGAEFEELLGATATTLFVVFDVARHAVIERARYLRHSGRILVALACFAALDALAVHLGITDNVLWAPTTPTRAVMLMITVAPLVAVAVCRKSSIRHH